MRRIYILIPVMLMLLSSLACFVPVPNGLVKDFVEDLFEPEVKPPDPDLPPIPVPADSSTSKNGIAEAAGTYKGTSTISDIWEKSFGGKVYLNNFEIIIDKSGKITGILDSAWQTEDSEPMSWEPSPGAGLHYCVTKMSNIDQGTITGSLMEPDGSRPNTYGLLEINMSAKKQIFRSDCPAEDENKLDYYKIYADIYITGNQLTGNLKDNAGGATVTIKAVKQ